MFFSLHYKYFKSQVSGIRSREPPAMIQVYTFIETAICLYHINI